MEKVTAETLYDSIQTATDSVRRHWSHEVEVGVVLGTGLGDSSTSMDVEVRVPYSDIPHFPTSSVESHKGELLLGTWSGKKTVAMSGRVHFYEGYSLREVTFPIRVMKALGARYLVLSSAVGGMNRFLQLGDIVLVADHINLMGDNPLIGPNDDRLGPRFPDMSEPYSRELMAKAEKIALRNEIRLSRAVYVAVSGPNLETAAEYAFLRQIGADVVGMSMVPENIVAIHSGMKVAGFAVVTDLCFPDSLEPANIDRILRVAAEAEPKLERLVTELLQEI
jgi:purine-nucleoside phosphorylase